MKRIFYPVAVTILFAACSTGPHYLIDGKIAGSDTVKFILLKKEAGSYMQIDSAVSRKGSFKMKGSVEFPDIVQLIAVNTGYRTSFYLENSRITVSGRLDSLFNAKITGSKTNDEYRSLIEAKKPLSEKYSDLYIEYQMAYQTEDTAKTSRLEKEIESVLEQRNAVDLDFIKSNPASYLAPMILKDHSYEMEAEEIKAAIEAMDTNVARTPVVKELMEKVALMIPVSIGKKAPDFTLNDLKGNAVTLSSKVGVKLLLIDFWASWCNPCRQENPNIVKLYNEFHKQGFDILGVSLDTNRDAWLKAVAADKLTWTQVNDPGQYDDSVAKLYAVDLIPSNFLLDETGTIIARNVTGKDLYNKVKELLGNRQ